MTQDALVDCQAHIIDPARFPLTAPRGYKPRSDESGTREELAAILDAQGIRHAVLVQLSGYGTDNAPLLDAMAAYPGASRRSASSTRRSAIASSRRSTPPAWSACASIS
jgi:predicted TIM-barrel fold metal-dependent hydrolase